MTSNTDQVWRDFHAQLRRYIKARIGNQADAEDILQEVFLRVHRRLDSLRAEENLRAWVFRVARNAVIDHLRRRRPDGPGEAVEAASRSDVREENSHDLTPCLDPLMEQLPQSYRQTLQLTDLGGLTQKAAADALSLSLSGMKSRVQRGREKLKLLLEDCCDIEVDRYGNVLHRSPRAKPLTGARPTTRAAHIRRRSAAGRSSLFDPRAGPFGKLAYCDPGNYGLRCSHGPREDHGVHPRAAGDHERSAGRDP